MRIACLQFAPILGDLDNNLNRADSVLDEADPQDLDLLVLPELAFSGYNFKSLSDIARFLEPCGTGISSLWARSQALKHDCTVIVGYPEKVDLVDVWPANPEYYNSAAVINSDGDDIGNYQKSHLYYTDESWALEGHGFFSESLGDLGQTAIGICMDINPCKFEAPWDKFEFATHVLKTGAKLVVVSMAWITHEDQRSFIQKPDEPDMDTLSYWISRIEPIIRTESDEEIIVVFANRSGIEQDATYTGSSAVVGVKAGEVSVYGILGRGEKKLLVVDTDDEPFAKLVYRPEAKPTKTPVPEPSNFIDREAPREVKGGRLNSGAPTESAPSKRKQMGEAQPPQVPVPANKKGDDLTVKLYEKDKFDKQPRNRDVHTPSAPSPTPHSIRPQFSSQPTHYDVHTRADVELPALYHSPMMGGDEPQLIDPEATARRLGLIRNISPSRRSESPRSDCSISSSKLYWNPQEQSAVQPTRRPQFELTAEELFSELQFMDIGENNRHSARSDIAVWNNEPGHPRHGIVFPSTSQEAKVRNTLHASERQRAPSQDASRRGNKSRHGPPGMSKSRNDSRAERKDRAVPSILPQPDMVAAYERFEEFAQRAETAHRRFESMRESSKPVNAAPSEEDPRIASSNRQRSLKPPSQSKVKREPSNRSMSVSFAVDSGSMKESNRSNKAVHGRSTSTKVADPPILRPASRSRINREVKRDRNIEANRSMPGNAALDSRVQPVNQDHRAMSRGRNQSASQPSTHSEVLMRSRTTRCNAHKRHESDQDATDLARTKMIEDYAAQNHSFHGSRSRSRAGHRSSSRQKTSGTPRTRQQATFQQEKEIQADTQITPRTGNRRAPDSAKVPFKLTTDMPKPSRDTESSALQSQHRQNGSVSDVPSSASTLSPGHDPQTPIAMILVPDTDGAQSQLDMSWIPTSKGVGRGTVFNLTEPLGVGY